jgi:hypothetical protein
MLVASSGSGCGPLLGSDYDLAANVDSCKDVEYAS